MRRIKTGMVTMPVPPRAQVAADLGVSERWARELANNATPEGVERSKAKDVARTRESRKRRDKADVTPVQGPTELCSIRQGDRVTDDTGTRYAVDFPDYHQVLGYKLQAVLLNI